MRVVLDTNLLYSALITPGGPADRLYLAWRDRLFTLVTSEEQLEEFRRVTRYPRVRQFIDPAAAGTLHNELRHLAILLKELPVVEVSRDPGDDFLLSMNSFQKTRIVTARQMLVELGRV